MQLPEKKDLEKLESWLKRRPWAGQEMAEDLVQSALLASLERDAKGLKPRNLYYLAKEAARRQGLLPSVRQTGAQKGVRRLSRLEIEVGVDLGGLDRIAAPAVDADPRIERLECFLKRFGCGEIRRAVEMIRQGHDQAEAAAQVGWSPVKLTRALAELGRTITGRQPIRYCRRSESSDQLGLFSAGEV